MRAGEGFGRAKAREALRRGVLDSLFRGPPSLESEDDGASVVVGSRVSQGSASRFLSAKPGFDRDPTTMAMVTIASQVSHD